MRKLKLVVDLTDLQLPEEDKQKSPIEISTQVIENVIFNYAQQTRGLSEQERRLFYKISDLFDEAKTKKLEEITIDDEYAAFIRKAFRESRLFPNKLLRQVEDNITETKEKIDETEEKKI